MNEESVSQANQDDFQVDAAALLGALSGAGPLSNPYTGFGTDRDPFSATEVNPPRRLTEQERIWLVQSSGICEKAVWVLPTESELHFPIVSVASSGGSYGGDSGGSTSSKTAQLQSYLDEYYQAFQRGTPAKVFAEAAGEARWHGNAYVLLGIDDGREWHEPVDRENIQSVRWIEVLYNHECEPDISTGYSRPLYYRINLLRPGLDAEVSAATVGEAQKEIESLASPGSLSVVGRNRFDTRSTLVHKDRIFHFAGKRLTGKALEQANGKHDSVLTRMFNAFVKYTSGLDGVATVLIDHSLFVYAIDGLSAMMRTNKNLVTERYLNMQIARSVLKGIAIDRRTEEASFLTRQYAGLDNAIEVLLSDLVAATDDLTRSKLFGAQNKQGLGGEGRGEQDRREWAVVLESWMTRTYTEPLTKLVELCCLAKDGPTNGTMPSGIQVKIPSTMQLTELEQLETESKRADVYGKLINHGIVDKYEVRLSVYGDTDNKGKLTLDKVITAKKQKESLMEESDPNYPGKPGKPGGNTMSTRGSGRSARQESRQANNQGVKQSPKPVVKPKINRDAAPLGGNYSEADVLSEQEMDVQADVTSIDIENIALDVTGEAS